MRIAVIAAITRQGERGDAEAFYDGMIGSLVETSHKVEKIEVIIDESSFDKILEAYVTCYDLDLRDYDLVISTKAPTFMVRHRNHVSYLLHTIRVFYDMFHQELDTGTPDRHKQRHLIHAFDAYGLHPNRVRKHFSVGFTPYKRLSTTDPSWDKIAFEVLHPPPYPMGSKQPNSGEYVFVPGGLHRWKRVDLVIKALNHIDKDIPLKIAGTGEDEATLRALAAADPRIEFLGRVSDEQLIDLYAGALVVPFVPFNEDYSFNVIAAFRSKKPVITCIDSGEPTYFVQNFETGFVVEPDPQAIAAKIDYFIDHPETGVKMGAKGYSVVSHIDWDTASSRLLGAINSEERPVMGRGFGFVRPEQPRRDIEILVVGNQVLDPLVGTDRLRLYHLYRRLARSSTITYVGAYDRPGPAYREQTLAANFAEISIPLTQVHFGLNSVFERLVGQKAILDVTMPLLLKYTPRFAEVVNSHATDAAVIILSHPWVYPHVSRRSNQLLVYDAQHCKSLLKEATLGKSLVARYLARVAKKIEGELCQASDLIFACSEEDKRRLVQECSVQEEKVCVIPNGVDTGDIQPASRFERQTAKAAIGVADAQTVLYVGNNARADIEAAEFILRVLAPELPGLQFLMLGGMADAYLLTPEGSALSVPANVRFFRPVDEAFRYTIYKASDLAINPMLSPSVTDIKILEYMAAGIPVISTPHGIRGVDAPDDTFIVCEASEFARHIRTALDDTTLLYGMSKKARELGEDKFDWDKIAERAYSIIHSHTGNFGTGKPSC